MAEVRGMVAAGFKEIVLTGIHISSYGLDFENRNYTGTSRLIELTEQLHEIEGLERIRLGSLEPRIITEDTAKRLSALPKLCPHFHLSLQSGCDATLRRMNRHYTTEEYAESVALLRSVFEHPAITTDVIVGFPGETEEEFDRTKAFLDEIGFFEMHIFKYSKRAGTRAAGMPDQVSNLLKTKRSEEVNGTRYMLGHTGAYVKVAVPVDGRASELQSNRVIRSRIQGFLTDEILVGEQY